MINLLPADYADAIRYGRQNTKLRNWLIGAGLAVVGLIVIFVSGWFYIGQQSKILQKNIDTTNQQLQAQNLAKVQADAKEITGDIKVINQVLGSEIRFSDLIQTIGNDMPSGTVLGGLSLGKVTGGLDLTVGAKDHVSVAQAAVNLSDPKNQLFSKLDIVSVACDSTATGPYPCSATFRALFDATARTKFLNVPKAAK
jgi:Tfp pilus assembly protein PilN